MSESQQPKLIDSRGPRFGAGVNFFLSVAALVTGLIGGFEATAAERAASPAFILLGIAWLGFALGTIFGNGASPWSLIYRTLVQPRLSTPAPKEDPRPPRFALGVGLVLSTAGLVLDLVGAPWALEVASAFIVIASFLNAFVGFCLGCQVYLLLIRGGIIRPKTPIAA